MQTTTADRHPAETPVVGSPLSAEMQCREPVASSTVESMRDGAIGTGPLSRDATREARMQDLLHRARAEDVLHWQHHQRPISAETLRKRLEIGTRAARGLVVQLRTDTHTALDGQADLLAR
jgi:hypothetical protein